MAQEQNNDQLHPQTPDQSGRPNAPRRRRRRRQTLGQCSTYLRNRGKPCHSPICYPLVVARNTPTLRGTPQNRPTAQQPHALQGLGICRGVVVKSAPLCLHGSPKIVTWCSRSYRSATSRSTSHTALQPVFSPSCRVAAVINSRFKEIHHVESSERYRQVV